MSIWDAIKDNIVDHYGAGNKIYHGITGDPTSRDKRHQQEAINAQIKAYRDQTELAKRQLDEAKSATDAEKRRVNEKQIRSLRRNYRAAGSGSGLLGIGQTDMQDMNAKLGG